MLTVFWDMKGPISLGFFEKDAAVNSAQEKFPLSIE